MTKIDYKTDRQREEMESGSVNIRLVKILQLALEWTALNYPKYDKITITDIFRTPEEQDKIYLNHKDENVANKYRKKKWYSVHQFWRGLDIRVNDMGKGQAELMCDFLNTIFYDKNRPNKKTAILHDVGTGSHIHLQVMG